MTDPSRPVLMPLWEGAGAVPPQLGVAHRLVSTGRPVHVLADPTIEEAARSAGCGFSPWRRAPHATSLDPDEVVIRDWEADNPLAVLRRMRDEFIAGPAADYAADTAEVVEAVDPAAVVSDYMLMGAIIAARGAGLPVAAVIPNIWMIPMKGVPAVGPGFQPARTVVERIRDTALLAATRWILSGGIPALNEAREAHGLPPVRSFYEPVLQADRILVLSSPTFDFSSHAVPDNVRYVGPVLDDPVWVEPWAPPWPEDDRRPLVLVAFSSGFQDQATSMRRAVEALSGLPVRAVATLGRALDPDDVPSPENVHVVRSAPHEQILEAASLAVIHCGHGTTMRSLLAGVPIVCMPMGRDQDDTAARIVHHGAGVRVSPDAEAAAIREAVEEVLRREEYRTAARRLGTAIEEERRRSDVAREVGLMIGVRG